MLKWLHQNIPSRLLEHAFVKLCHFAPYLCSLLPQRSAILSQHIMFHLAPGITYGWNAPCHLYVLSLSQSKWCEMWKRSKWLYSIIFSGSATWFIIAVYVQISTVTFFPKVPFCPQRIVFHFTPDITFQYNASCQLHYHLLLDQKDVKICKRGK